MAAPVFQLHPDAGSPPVEEPNPTEIMPSPAQPLDVARILLDELTEDGHLQLRRWRSGWWEYQGPHWVEAENEGIRKWLYLRMEHASFMAPAKKDGDEPTEKPWAPDKGKVDKLVDAMVAPTLLNHKLDAPSWVSTGKSATNYVPCINGLVDVTTRKLRTATADYFGSTCIPIVYDPDAGPATEWMRFLRILWPPTEDGSEADEVQALAQWFGYILSGRLDLQKALLLVGPPRSGKGTIARILTALLGQENVAAPTLAGLCTNFGLQPLLSKTLAVVGDARLQPNGHEDVVARILSITGKDSITVDRKNREAWSGTIPARMMVLSNELPRFVDASGAIASRFVILSMQESFLGKEDIGLEDRLLTELPAILNWALDGLAQLNQRGRITEPVASEEAVQMLADLVSPIKAFLREVCVVDAAQAVPFSRVYAEYKEWCEENGRGAKNTAGLSSDLRTALPQIKTDYRPKVDGRPGPRHVRGLSLSPEWVSRVKDTNSRW